MRWETTEGRVENTGAIYTKICRTDGRVLGDLERDSGIFVVAGMK
jgi:hypothetical protein